MQADDHCGSSGSLCGGGAHHSGWSVALASQARHVPLPIIDLSDFRDEWRSCLQRIAEKLRCGERLFWSVQFGREMKVVQKLHS